MTKFIAVILFSRQSLDDDNDDDDDSILIQKSNSQLLAPVSLVFRYTILKHIHTHTKMLKFQ